MFVNQMISFCYIWDSNIMTWDFRFILGVSDLCLFGGIFAFITRVEDMVFKLF